MSWAWLRGRRRRPSLLLLSMVNIDEQMSNTITGERFVWRATRASTGGEYCEFDLHLSPHAKVAAPHRHPRQIEEFTVLEGSVTFRRGRGRQEWVTAGAGESVEIPLGTAHSWGNTSPQGSLVRVRLTPALRTEEYFATFCAIATSGRASRLGMARNPLQLAIIFADHLDEFSAPNEVAQRVLVPVITVLAAIARRLGYSSTVRL